MQKKKFDLTSEIIDINLGGEGQKQIAVDVAPNKKENKSDDVRTKRVLITMAVDEDLRREYKVWCTNNGLKMAEAFLMGYNLLKKNTNNIER